MACANLKAKNIRYVNAELVSEDDSSNAVQLEGGETEYNINVAYSDAPTVYVQQGQYVIPVSGHTVVLQDDHGDFEQYIINENGEEQQDVEQMEEEMGQPIIYYMNEFADQQVFEETDEALTNNDSSGETLLPLSKQIKLEQNYVDADDEMQGVSIEDNFVQLEEEVGGEKIIVASPGSSLGQPQYQYAILKNGKLHLQSLAAVDASLGIAEDDVQHQQLREQLAAFQQSINLDEVISQPTIDLDKITGRNLITGQTVTLDSYFDKLQRRLATIDVTNQCLIYNSKKKHKSEALQGGSAPNKTTKNAFINKKVVVGKTSNGKRIVGKILRIHSTKSENNRKDEGGADKLLKAATEVPVITSSASTSTSDRGVDLNNTLSSDEELPAAEQEQQSFQPQIIIKKHVVTRENFDYSIGKTLTGLMGLETVQRRLQNRNLMVKLVEKAYDHGMGGFNKTVSYVYGHMALVNVQDEKADNQGWVFVLHNENDSLSAAEGDESESTSETGAEMDTGKVQRTKNISRNAADDSAKATCLEESDKAEDEIKDVSLEMEDTGTEYNETISLTIAITVDKNGKKSTRVNMSPQQSDNRCHICNKEFKMALQLRKHISNVHFCQKSAKCDFCGKYFSNQAVLQRHQKIHMGERWYGCPQCSKSFNTAGSLKRHVTVHDPSLRPLECSVCVQRFTDESSLRKHLLIHTGIRAYACEVCNRAFVNQGDLNFHRRIHDPVKQFSCEVCGREFSRHSNLMRHAEIHRGAGALHRCDICGCSYSFISSLTRHIVQKHIGHHQE